MPFVTKTLKLAKPDDNLKLQTISINKQSK